MALDVVRSWSMGHCFYSACTTGSSPPAALPGLRSTDCPNIAGLKRFWLILVRHTLVADGHISSR